MAEERGMREISFIQYIFHCWGKPDWLANLVLQGVPHLPSWAVSPAGLSVPLLLQTSRQALLAGTKLPWAGAGTLMVKGRARGHSKSFTNISQSFIIFALPTAAHKSTKVHELHPPQRISADWGSPLSSGHQKARRTQSPNGCQGQRDAQARVALLGP